MLEFPAEDLQRLWQTIERLLSPAGCPWDREQRLEDISRYIIEEGHESLEACRQGESDGQVEELGDLAYLIIFALQVLAAEQGRAPAEVLRAIDAKLKRRHPQIFPGAGATEAAQVDSSAKQLRVWESIKREERRARGKPEGLLKRLPASMGALAKSHRYQDKAATVGFDWPDLTGVISKLREELDELWSEMESLPSDPPAGDESPSVRYRHALACANRGRLRDELGDLFFVIANLCRWLDMDAEEVVEGANAKFLRRFTAMERRLKAAGGSLETADLPEMEGHWQAVKREEASSGT